MPVAFFVLSDRKQPDIRENKHEEEDGKNVFERYAPR